MTEREIIEGNKAIEYFIGFEKPVQHEYEYFINRFYHSSWEKLMSAVNKIESVGLYNVRINRFFTVIECFDPFKAMDISKAGITPSKSETQINKIQATWLAVVDFIRWYNSNVQ